MDTSAKDDQGPRLEAAGHTSMSQRTGIYSHSSAFHDITVVDHGFIRVLSFGHHRQSSMYLDAPNDTDFEYPGHFHLALAVKPDAARTLAVGLGGGTVVKRMWRDYPSMRIDAVELDASVVDVARRFFALPDDARLRVFVDDGRRFLEASHDMYDIVIVDAFDDDRIPPQLADDEFFRLLRDRLTPGGAVVYNVMGTVEGDGGARFSSLQKRLASEWERVWTFVVNEGVEAGGGTNLILLATDAPLTTTELQSRIASRVDDLVTVPAFHLFGEDLRKDVAE